MKKLYGDSKGSSLGLLLGTPSVSLHRYDA